MINSYERNFQNLADGLFAGLVVILIASIVYAVFYYWDWWQKRKKND